jgi:PAS domain S-box-containing protein
VTAGAEETRDAIERQLRESEERFRCAFEDAGLGMALVTREGRNLRVNRALSAILGYTGEELLRITWKDIVHPEDLDASLRNWDGFDAGAYRAITSQKRYFHKDGQTVWVEVTLSMIRNDAGEPIHFLAQVRDISRERGMAAAQHRSEERYALVIDALEDGVWDHDLVQSTGLISPRYLSMLGYPPRTTITYDEFLALVHPDDRRDVLATTTRQVNDPTAGSYDMEFRMQRVDGTWARIRCRGRVVERDATGRGTRAIGTHTDVTERRMMEEQFRHTQKMEAIGKLAGGVAHDFNNLLTTISATTQVLREELPADDPHRTDLDQIALATDRAKALTGQLLAFSRLEVERRQHLSLDPAVRQAEPLLRRLLAPGQQLAMELAAPDAVVSLDPAQLELALLNLLANARDAMPDGGTVTIRTATPGPHDVMLAVIDSGHGMAAGVADRAFEPFFTTKPQGKGTGLGLATVYGFAERMGGGVALQTAPAKGTTVTLTLPVARETVRPVAPTAVAIAAPQHSTRRVLLVDDEEGVRRSTRRLLERRGYTVVEADSAAHALAILEGTTVDVLLTDHAMPGGTGRDLVRDVIDRHPQVRVVLMSGFAGEGQVLDEIRGRSIPFLAKPFTLEELVTILDASE